MVCVLGVATAFGIGFTTTNAVVSGPVQVPAVGDIVNVTVTATFVVLVKEPEILPLPLAAIPVTSVVLFLVQVYVVPITGLLKTISVIASPVQIV